VRGEGVEQVAEEGFAVGIAHGAELSGLWGKVGQLAVVGEGPVLPPEFAGKRMGIGQADTADVGLANMADDVFRLYRIGLDQFGDGGVVAWVRVVKKGSSRKSGATRTFRFWNEVRR